MKYHLSPLILAIGFSLIYGKGVSEDQKKPWGDYQENTTKAQNGDAQAQYIEAGVESILENHEDAAKWYRKAAEQGHAGAQCELGKLYESGTGVPQDLDLATSWLKKARDQGHKFDEKSKKVFDFLISFEGVSRCISGLSSLSEGNEKEAFESFRISAESGDQHGQYELGNSYYYGRGTEKSIPEAIKWYQKSADQGYSKAQSSIGYAYSIGEGLPKNSVEGVKWYRKAAEQADSEAEFNLGLAYYKGEGVIKENSEAVKWFRKAADKGHQKAQTLLSVSYADGDGVEKDYIQAYMWANLSSASGCTTGKKIRLKLEEEMSSEEVEKAQKLSGEWKPTKSKNEFDPSTAVPADE